MIALSTSAIMAMPCGMAMATPFSTWTTVVNNTNEAPNSSNEYFFSYNQPSINDEGLVVFRARAKAKQQKGEPTSGIFTRDMSVPDSAILAVAVRNDEVPDPNNIEEPAQAGTFNEFPSFPRIDAASSTLAFRGQSQPSVATSVTNADETDTTHSGTAGIYASIKKDSLTTGIRNIDAKEASTFGYQVPGTDVRFDQFPGAPSPIGSIITFKGNWTDPDRTQGDPTMTGVYYKDMAGDTDGNPSPVVKIAQRHDEIPAAATPGGQQYSTDNEPVFFGSTAPPSAADGKVVFTGLDDEANPSAGGIFMFDIDAPDEGLKTIAGFNTVVPKKNDSTTADTYLSAFGEALSFDGQYVGFWAGWGENKIKTPQSCGPDGNKDLLDYCNSIQTEPEGGEALKVLENQGIFLADTLNDKLFLVAQTGPLFEDQKDYFEDFLFWNFSGKPPGTGESSEDDSAELPRWRSSAFLAVDGDDIVFKARKSNGEIGLYGALDVATDVTGQFDIFTILTKGMKSGFLDPSASDMTIESFGIERDGLRNGRLAITASMLSDDGSKKMSGIYIAPVPEPGTMALFAIGLTGIGFWHRKKS